jgi:putative tricarboxylic transport membrane protein
MMNTYDLGSSLFWLFLSMAVCAESLRMGIGSLQNPGMGFLGFGASGLLGTLSLILFLQTIFKRTKTEIHSMFGPAWQSVIFILIALAAYAELLPAVGYLISTFLLLSFLFWIGKGKQKWWWVLAFSFLSTFISYMVFSVWLNCQYPRGPFRF